jgi:hypothetical protein
MGPAEILEKKQEPRLGQDGTVGAALVGILTANKSLLQNAAGKEEGFFFIPSGGKALYSRKSG